MSGVRFLRGMGAAILVGAMVWTLQPRAQMQTALRTVPYASGLTAPIAIVQDPTNRSVQFVVEQAGRIRVVRAGELLPQIFLDIRTSVRSGGEQGLLGLAFAPDYATSRRFYVNFTNNDGHTVVARFVRSSDPLVADASSRFDLRWGSAGGPTFIEQPFSNHNGGNLVFGPDGFLYIGLGDGGSSNDPAHRAQNPAEWLGKMLRIDVNVPESNPQGYRVPADNPFVSGNPPGTRPEIWAFGLRNPWRYSFDDPALGGTGALVIGDVGQNRVEEISYEPRGRGGRNYGWRNKEGFLDNVTSLPPAFLPLINPLYEYGRQFGNSITGGYVYRGSALGATFRGRYIFADYVQGRVWSIAITLDGAGEAAASDLIEHTSSLAGIGAISSFGVDADGELFILNHAAGTVLRILGSAAAPPTPTGLRIVR